MPSALASQLAAAASLNASLLLDRPGKRKQTESYLFTGRDADTHDLDSLHALAANAFVQLCNLSPAFTLLSDKAGTDFEQVLFSDAARDTDRTMQSNEVVSSLDMTLSVFLKLLGPWLMEAPAGKVLEWLVRRFRINEFNVEDTISLFLPYHESPHFAKMLSILHIKPNSQFSFMLPFKSAAKPLSRIGLVTAMVDNADVGRFVAGLLPAAIKVSCLHHTLLAFNSATMHDFLARLTTIDEGTLAYVLPALLAPLHKTQNNPSAILGSYVLLFTLSHKIPLTPPAICAIISAMATAATSESAQSQHRLLSQHFLKSAIAVCAAQDEVQTFKKGTDNTILNIPGLAEEIPHAFKYSGVEKFILPLLETLKARLEEPRITELFSIIVNAAGVPSVIVRRASSILVGLAVRGTEESTSAVRSLLSLMHQRHSDILRSLTEEITLDEDEKEKKNKVDQLMISFSVSHPWAERTDVNEIVVASTNATKETRVQAVQKLYGILDEAESEEGRTLGSVDLMSIHSALFARIYDTQASVLQALYSSPKRFLDILSASVGDTTEGGPRSPSAFFSTVLDLITRGSPGRAVLSAHLSFLAGPFVVAHPSFTSDVQAKAFFPYLLASKAKFRTALNAWEALKDGDAKTRDEGWLKGCVEVWQESGVMNRLDKGSKQVKSHSKDGEEDVEKLCAINLKVAAKVADNIIKSTNPADLASIISHLQSPLPHGRALAYLVLRASLLASNIEQQIAIGVKVLQTMQSDTLDLLESTDDEKGGLQKVLDDQEVGMKATVKPGGRVTTQVLQTSILALVPAIKRPDTLAINWTANIVDGSDAEDIASRYVCLLRKFYAQVTSCSSPLSSRVSYYLLQALFLRLRDDSLAFLLGILISSSAEDVERVRIPVLLHTLAFLRGHAERNAVDFQVLVPSLIYILLDPNSNKRARELVFECLKAIRDGGVKKHVYGFDTIYGEQSADLQYLDSSDFATYLAALLKQEEEIIQDANYLKILHQQHITGNKYKRRVLCFFISHVIGSPSPAAKVALLRSIEDVSDPCKARLLFPKVKELAEGPNLVAKLFGPAFDDYAGPLVAASLTIPVFDLNNQKDSIWTTFVSLLQYLFQTNSSSTTRNLVTASLQNGLFVSLSSERQTEICNVLLKMGSEGGDAYIHSKGTLSIILQDTRLICQLLRYHQPNIADLDPPAPKRAKLDDTSRIDGNTTNIPSLTLLAEVLGTKDLPDSLDLITQLLETISKVTHRDSQGFSDTNYIVQMLMSAVEGVANKIKEVPGKAIRLDVLLELIRASDNPQTFHQALLLMGSLARLTPDSVLHNVMPIFTFMGSNIFHRDDSYSFRVVQKTIESIVPVMVSSLTEKHPEGLDLYVASRDFLRIFTDACGHIPRHRRSNFFVHLIEVLGAHEFLAPVCMLLLDRTASKVSRQRPEEAQASLAFPISLLHHFPGPLQLYVLVEILQESKRLVSHIVDSTYSSTAFLEFYRDEEQPTSSASILKRRAQALVIFAGYALQPSSPTNVTEVARGATTTKLMGLFIDLLTVQGNKTSESNLSDLSATTQRSMAKALGAMTVLDFTLAVLTMLQSNEDRIQIGALELLAERLPQIKDKARRGSLETITQIVDRIQHLLSLQSAGTLIVSALHALSSLGRGVCPGEEASLATTLPSIIKIIKVRTAAESALAVLACFVPALGPRVIPHFREIVKECTLILQEDVKGKREQSTIAVVNTINTLQSLLSSLPAFWGKDELKPIIDVHLASYALTQYPTTALIKAFAKRIPAKILLPTVYDAWWSLDQTQKIDASRISGFFFVFKRSLHAAPRAEVLEHLRPIFKVFLDALDCVAISSHDIHKGESPLVSAFLELVVKLNDSAFKPLFRRLYDWAFATDSDHSTRKVAFCHLYIALLDFFKGLMNPYMTFLLQPVCEFLQSFDPTTRGNALWNCILEVLVKSLENDDGAFWRDDRLRQLAKPLVNQVAICIQSDIAEEKRLLVKVLSAMTGSTTDDTLLKTINLDILMHTRSEDARLRVYALSCAETLWREHGGKLLGFVAETATFISECAEDENDTVVKEAHKLKNAVENIAGNINGL